MLNGFEEGFQLPGSRWMAQLAQRLGFDLTNTFARHGKMLANFLKRVLRSCSAETKTHLDHLLFARRERSENFVGDFAQVRSHHRVRRIQDGLVFDEVAEMRVLF